MPTWFSLYREAPLIGLHWFLAGFCIHQDGALAVKKHPQEPPWHQSTEGNTLWKGSLGIFTAFFISPNRPRPEKKLNLQKVEEPLVLWARTSPCPLQRLASAMLSSCSKWSCCCRLALRLLCLSWLCLGPWNVVSQETILVRELCIVYHPFYVPITVCFCRSTMMSVFRLLGTKGWLFVETNPVIGNKVS